jgi:hypothetical protein
VKIRRGAWNEELFRVLEGFPDLAHDNEVGAWSGVLKMLNPRMKSWGLYELIRRQAEEFEQQREPELRKTQWAPGSAISDRMPHRETEGSNPASSTGESGTNLTFSPWKDRSDAAAGGIAADSLALRRIGRFRPDHAGSRASQDERCNRPPAQAAF